MDIVEEGRGGLHAVAKCLEGKFENGVAVAVFRVTAVDDRGVTVSYRTKIIHIIYAGPKLPMLKRAKVTSYNSSFKSAFTHNQSYQLIGDLSPLNEADIEKSLRASGGAHQPTSFDFTNDSEKFASGE